MSKIIQLTAENVKRLSAVQITPDGNMIVIGGRNGQGKSSVLDAIQYALGGDPSDPMPVHRGESKARVVVDLGDIVVQRTFTAEGGTSLTVKDKDGVKQSTPQALLDKLAGKLTFDPLDFARQKPPKQAEILRGIVGLDFAHHDRDRQQAFDERTVVNRDVKTLEARMKAMPSHKDAPAQLLSAAEILEQQRAASEKNQKNAEKRNEAKRLRGAANTAASGIKVTEDEIRELESQLANKRRLLEVKLAGKAKEEETAAAAEAEAQALQDEDMAPFGKQLLEIESTNNKFRDNQRRAEVVKQFKAKSDEADALTAKIESMDSQKRKATTEAKYPIEGLLFDTAGGVTLNGIPFEQCSSAEQLKVSVAIGLALNPKLRVLLIRDGSLLDEESLKMVAEMADKADAQVWMERVGTDAATSVVIEDGQIAGKPTKEKAAEATLL